MKLTNEQKMKGLAKLGIASTIRGKEFEIHADKVPKDADIEAAYLQAEEEKPLTIEQRIERLENAVLKG
jgi:hypothetical protein